jgi:D-arabinose 1-dehydrogenase-like Zn-dependent alcohol dehydrogenase
MQRVDPHILADVGLVGTLAPGQKECVDYSFKHNIFGHVTERKLEDFNELVENMKHDRVTGRQVVVFD